MSGFLSDVDFDQLLLACHVVYSNRLLGAFTLTSCHIHFISYHDKTICNQPLLDHLKSRLSWISNLHYKTIIFSTDLFFRICLVCREVFCSRYVNEHMVGHNSTSGHQLAISMADLSVWCYACDYYVDNAKLFPAKNALHKSKFGEEMPQTAVDVTTNPHLEIV